MAETPDDAEIRAVRALEERLARATEAAERLLGETARPPGPPGPPASGWQQPNGSHGDERERFGGWFAGDDGDLLLALIAGLRDRIPPDLQERLAGALRELLLAVRALIDWCVERSERRRTEPSEVQDIPIL